MEEDHKLYIMYGSFLRKNLNSNFGENFDNIWSFSFKEEKWTRERLRGNFPSPRGGMACAYHTALKTVVSFGGVSDKTALNLYPKHGEEPETLHCADTFIMDNKLMGWKQVITRNFPPWRACSRMLIDDADGKIYIYGGTYHYLLSSLYGLTSLCFVGFCNMPDIYTSDETCFGDLWRLDLDIPGHGYFSEEAFQKFSPFKAGSYRRCFSCNKIDLELYRCEGVCGGKAIYCSRKCQKADWKRHKSSYGCGRQ